MYLPLHYDDAKKPFFSVSFKNLYMFTASLPLGGFFVCVLLTMYKDFESANHTHCNVPNVFPSISASIGNYSPQIYIWQIAIYLHSPGRFITVYFRLNYYRSVISERYLFIVYIAVILNAIENLALLGLTHWTSLHNYPMHEMCFKTFIATSLFYMGIMCYLLTYKRRKTVELTLKEKRSVDLKWRCFVVNLVSFACAAYFFLRHNQYCEPYVYSYFGLAEYVVVVSNICFHLTTIYDLHRRTVVLTSKGLVLY